jgi:hypothetical protein
MQMDIAFPRNDRTPVRIPIIRNANRLSSAGTGAVPASRSHHLYSVREAELGSPSNTALITPSKNVITLTCSNWIILGRLPQP